MMLINQSLRPSKTMSEQFGNGDKLETVNAKFLETGELQNNEDEALEDSHDSFIILETTDEQVNDNKTLKEMAKIYTDNLLYSSKEDVDSFLVVSEDIRSEIDVSFVTTNDECIDKKVHKMTDSIGAKDLNDHSEQLISFVEKHTYSDKMCTKIGSCVVKPGDERYKKAEKQTEVAESFYGNHEAPEFSSTRKQTLLEILQQENNLVGQEDIAERVDQTDLKHDKQATGGSDVKQVKTNEGQATGFQEHVIKKVTMREPSDIDLLLIGKTGNGKSATGNSILRRKAFLSRSSSTSVTTKVAYEVSEFNGRVIKVVDGPGVGDTRMNSQEAVNLVMSEMEYAIAANPRGYHAFLLVSRFGGRFTAEDQDTIAFLKKIFGKEFVRDYCILVLTCGDNFENESEETGLTFEEWCRQQTGLFAELMGECSHRVLLFDNSTKDQEKKCGQLQRLITMVDTLRFRGHRYTDDNFNEAKETRRRIMIEAKKPMIHEEMIRETSLIIQKVQELQLQDDLNKKIKPLQDLEKRAETLYQSISSQDCGTGALHDLCETVNSIKGTVENEIRFCNRMKEERERIKREEEKTRQLFEDKMRKQKEEFEKRFREERLAEEERRENEMKLEKARREEEAQRMKEREDQEKKLLREVMEEQMKQRQRADDLERRYLEAKEANDKGFFAKIVKVVSWPFRKIKGWFS